jgi:hypothetical protein
MTTTKLANEILMDSLTKRGLRILESHTGAEMNMAALLVNRGLLSFSVESVTIPGGPQLYGPDTEDRTEMCATYRATELGRQMFCAGSILM